VPALLSTDASQDRCSESEPTHYSAGTHRGFQVGFGVRPAWRWRRITSIVSATYDKPNVLPSMQSRRSLIPCAVGRFSIDSTTERMI